MDKFPHKWGWGNAMLVLKMSFVLGKETTL